MQVTINEIKTNATFLNDANDLQLEDAIGSDVAHVQSTEINVNAVDEDDTMMHGENDSDGSLPLRYSFVLSSSQDNHLGNATKLKAFQKMVNTGSAELQHDDFQVNSVLNATEDTPVTNDPNTDVDSLFNENLDFGIEEEEHPAITSIRDHDPVSEFDSSDQIITTSFPCVFLLGHAYGWSTGNWSAVQRRHLLGQFTLIPAKARSLLGYMFDVMTCVESINGVVSCVKGNKKSITAISSIIEKLQQNKSILQKAISRPNSKGVKRS